MEDQVKTQVEKLRKLAAKGEDSAFEYRLVYEEGDLLVLEFTTGNGVYKFQSSYHWAATVTVYAPHKNFAGRDKEASLSWSGGGACDGSTATELAEAQVQLFLAAKAKLESFEDLTE